MSERCPPIFNVILFAVAVIFHAAKSNCELDSMAARSN